LHGDVVLSSVGLSLLVAVIAIVIALAFEDMLYFDSKLVRGGAQELSKASEALRARGLRVIQEPGGYLVRGPIEVQLTLLGAGEESRILGRMRVAPWFLAAILVVMALNVAIGAALAFLGYLYYRNLRKALDHALPSGEA